MLGEYCINDRRLGSFCSYSIILSIYNENSREQRVKRYCTVIDHDSLLGRLTIQLTTDTWRILNFCDLAILVDAWLLTKLGFANPLILFCTILTQQHQQSKLRIYAIDYENNERTNERTNQPTRQTNETFREVTSCL